MQQIAIKENELATRWGVSPKTLQCWRSEGRGPRYLKLVRFKLDEVTAWTHGSGTIISDTTY